LSKARAINPEIRIRRLDRGATPETIDEFPRDSDLFVDGLADGGLA
jgi:hypothetical protein